MGEGAKGGLVVTRTGGRIGERHTDACISDAAHFKGLAYIFDFAHSIPSGAHNEVKFTRGSRIRGMV